MFNTQGINVTKSLILRAWSLGLKSKASYKCHNSIGLSAEDKRLRTKCVLVKNSVYFNATGVILKCLRLGKSY